jgi:hypothetical protein
MLHELLLSRPRLRAGPRSLGGMLHGFVSSGRVLIEVASKRQPDGGSDRTLLLPADPPHSFEQRRRDLENERLKSFR